MAIARLFVSDPLTVGETFSLAGAPFQHLRALRLRQGDPIVLFNGQGGAFSGTLIKLEKRQASITLETFSAENHVSTFPIHLGQGLTRGESMDLVIQKGTELGVTSITPLLTHFATAMAKPKSWENKMAHWKNVMIHAAEQSGRNLLPTLNEPIGLEAWLAKITAPLKICFHLNDAKSFSSFNPIQKNHDPGATILVGPEGGLTEQEVSMAKASGFLSVSLGPRILRAETAAIMGIGLLQFQFGDLNEIG